MTGKTRPTPAARDPAGSPRRRAGSPLWARLCVVLGALLILFSAGTATAVKGFAYRFEHAVTKDDLRTPEVREPTTPRAQISGPLNFLLIGSDLRSRTPGQGERADAIIVVHVPRSLDRAYLVSIPRDLLVRIPPYPPTAFAGGQMKINAAFQYGGGGRGGAQLLSSTLAALIEVRFSGTAVINFDGFEKAVDVLGGVYLCVDRTVASNHVGVSPDGRVLRLSADAEGHIVGVPPGGHPYVFEQGCRRTNGMLALEYTRIRYGLPGGDYDRQRHQQQFLKAVLQEATRDRVITNPGRFDEFLRAVGGNLTINSGEVGVADLIFGLRNVTPSTLVGVQVPSHPDMIGGVSYVLPDREAVSLYRAVSGETLDEWVIANPSWVERL